MADDFQYRTLLIGWLFLQDIPFRKLAKKQDFQFSKVSDFISNPSEIVSFELLPKTKISFFWQYVDYLRAILIMMVISDALSILC